MDGYENERAHRSFAAALCAVLALIGGLLLHRGARWLYVDLAAERSPTVVHLADPPAKLPANRHLLVKGGQADTQQTWRYAYWKGTWRSAESYYVPLRDIAAASDSVPAFIVRLSREQFDQRVDAGWDYSQVQGMRAPVWEQPEKVRASFETSYGRDPAAWPPVLEWGRMPSLWMPSALTVAGLAGVGFGGWQTLRWSRAWWEIRRRPRRRRRAH